MKTTIKNIALCLLVVRHMRKGAAEDTALTALLRLMRKERPGYLVWKNAQGNAEETPITHKGMRRVERFLESPGGRVGKESWTAQATPQGICLYWDSTDRRPLCVIPLWLLGLELREEIDKPLPEGFGDVVALFGGNTLGHQDIEPDPVQETQPLTYHIVDVKGS